jgi:hypothetical protein
MTDKPNFAAKDTFSVGTNGLGTVTITMHDQAKPTFMTSDEARELARHLNQMANDADWQNTAL